jgi:hypothetical protein
LGKWGEITHAWGIAKFIPLMEFGYCLKRLIDYVFPYGHGRNLKTEFESGIMYLPETKV